MKWKCCVPVLLLDVLSMAWSLAVSYLLSFGLFVVNTIILGHLGTQELAGGALGTMTCNLTGSVIIIGLLSGMDTLSSQAYGAGNYPRVGLILQRGIVICCTWLLACAAIWAVSDKLLILVGQSPEDARLARLYALYFLWAMPAVIIYESVRRFLQCQSIVKPMLWIMLSTAPFHVVGCWLLVFKCNLGFIGAPVALIITYWVQCLSLVGYLVVLRPHRADTWPGWSRECFQGWGEYLKLGIPGALMTSMEWGCFEAMALIAGRLGTVYLASHSVLVNLVAVFFMFALGVSIATNVRVGQLLGEGRVDDAKKTSYYALMVGGGMGLFNCTMTLIFRHQIVAIFTTDSNVKSITVAAMLVMYFFPLADETQGVSQGILKGTGKQTIGTIVNVIGSYGVGLPCAILFSFVAHLKLGGLWLGMTLGFVTIATLNCVMIYRIDWAKESAKARRIALGFSVGGSSGLLKPNEEFTRMESEVIITTSSSPPLPEICSPTATEKGRDSSETKELNGNGVREDGGGGEGVEGEDRTKLCLKTKEGMIPTSAVVGPL